MEFYIYFWSSAVFQLHRYNPSHCFFFEMVIVFKMPPPRLTLYTLHVNLFLGMGILHDLNAKIGKKLRQHDFLSDFTCGCSMHYL